MFVSSLGKIFRGGGASSSIHLSSTRIDLIIIGSDEEVEVID